MDAWAANKALSVRMNKSDRSHAEALAQLSRTGCYREVHIKCAESDRLRLLLSAHDRRIRMDIEGQARGILKTFGICLGSVRAGWSRRNVRDQFHETVCLQATDLDREIQQIAKDSPPKRFDLT